MNIHVFQLQPINQSIFIHSAPFTHTKNQEKESNTKCFTMKKTLQMTHDLGVIHKHYLMQQSSDNQKEKFMKK